MRFSVLIVSPPGYIHSECFREVAETINDGLLHLGHQSQITTDVHHGTKHIVLGSNLLAAFPIELPADSILYNLEQVRDNELWASSDLVTTMRNFTVWDYTNDNAEEFKQNGIFVDAIVPIAYFDGLSRIQKQADQDIDVLFIGSMNERRNNVLAQMRECGLNAVWLMNTYGADRDRHIARAKLLLNVHFHKAKILEQVRISYYLANQCPVLSEHSSNAETDVDWAQGVFFSEYQYLTKHALELCRNDQARNQLAERGFAFMKQKTIVPALQRALEVRVAERQKALELR